MNEKNKKEIIKQKELAIKHLNSALDALEKMSKTVRGIGFEYLAIALDNAVMVGEQQKTDFIKYMEEILK